MPSADHTSPSDKPDIAAQRREALSNTALRWLEDWHPLSVADLKRLAVQNLSNLDTNGDGNYSIREINRATQKTDVSTEDAQFIYFMKRYYDDICKNISGNDGFYYAKISASSMDQLKENRPVQRSITFSELVAAEMNNLQSRITRLPRGLYASYSDPIESIKAQSVQQHSVGNCGWQASVAALAARNPMAIKNMIAEKPDDSYEVNMPGASKKNIHVTQPPAIEQLVSSWASPGGKWVGVLETALAKELIKKRDKNNTDLLQEATVGTPPESALKKLTGHQVVETTISTAETLAEIMKTAETHQLPQVATVFDNSMTPKKQVSGLLATHAYAIIGYNPYAQRVTIYEPNGVTEPLDERGQALDGNRDGVFQMDLQEFSLCFSDLYTSVDKQTKNLITRASSVIRKSSK